MNFAIGLSELLVLSPTACFRQLIIGISERATKVKKVTFFSGAELNFQPLLVASSRLVTSSTVATTKNCL